MTVLRTPADLQRAQWADKYMSVTEGKQYIADENGSYRNSPFPYHKYLRNGLLGKQVKMCEVNAGHAAVENMVSDMMTDLTLQVGDKETDGKAQEQEFREWMEDENVDFLSKLEETARDDCGVGYGVMQPFRLEDESMTIGTVDPSTWYPKIPLFSHQPITEGKIISVFNEGKNGEQSWYAFVEIHTAGKLEYKLYKIDNEDSLEGTEKPLSTISRFAGLDDSVVTDLDYMAVFQVNRRKSSRNLFGQSILFPIWDILQEVSETQTQIRQERIKHLRGKMYGDAKSFQRTTNPDTTNPNQLNSKQLGTATGGAPGVTFDLNQEILTVPNGGIIPGYIQRDLQAITVGSAEIDKLLSRASAVAGLPRSIFNLDETGQVHEGTDRRKYARYVRQVIQGQKQMAFLVKKTFLTWWAWTQDGDPPPFKATFANPFGMTQEEVMKLMREGNASAVFVSQEEAIKRIWPDMKPEDRDTMIQAIKDESAALMPPGSALNQPPDITL